MTRQLMLRIPIVLVLIGIAVSSCDIVALIWFLISPPSEPGAFQGFVRGLTGDLGIGLPVGIEVCFVLFASWLVYAFIRAESSSVKRLLWVTLAISLLAGFIQVFLMLSAVVWMYARPSTRKFLTGSETSA